MVLIEPVVKHIPEVKLQQAVHLKECLMLFRYSIKMDIFVIERLEFYQASKIHLLRQTFYLDLFIFPLQTYTVEEKKKRDV